MKPFECYMNRRIRKKPFKCSREPIRMHQGKEPFKKHISVHEDIVCKKNIIFKFCIFWVYFYYLKMV